MKKLLSALLVTLLLASTFTSIVSASANVYSERSRYEYVSTYTIPLQNKERTLNNTEATIHIYNNNGIKVYELECDNLPEIKMLAFEALNNFMDQGIAEQTNVTVNAFNQEFYGNETGYGASSSAIGYTWARYNAGIIDRPGNYDSTWGGQSATWGGSGASNYIKLYQAVTLNITNANSTLSVSWPPALDVSQSRTTSTATWSSEPSYNATVLGAEHGFTQFNWEDIQRGTVTSCVYSDSADVKYGATIYKPTSSVRFINGF